MAYNEEVTMMMSVVPGAMTGISTMMSGLVSINNVFLDMTRQLDASFGLIDASIITTSTVVAQLGLSAAEAFGEFEQGLKVAQMVSGQTAQDMDYLRQKANEFSVSYRADIDQITEGLQTLGRAGLNSAVEQTEVLQNGLSTSKLEGRELNSVLEELIQNTALLGGNLKSSDFGEDSQYINDLLVATSMTAPITTHDVSETLKYSGGIAAAAGAKIRDEMGNVDEQGKKILEDYMGTVAAFAQKGVTGSIAGTALRAFLNKPATQDSSVTEALASIKLKPEYLWEDGEETMKPISEQISIIQGQMDKLNVSTMDRLQIWSKIVGGKMGQQMMKLDSSSIKELTNDIRAADDAESLASGTFQTYQAKMKEMTEQGQVAFREFGSYAAKMLIPLLEILKRIFEFFSNPVTSFGAFVGAFSIIGMAISRVIGVIKLLKTEFNQFKDSLLKGESLYSVRPSIIRSQTRNGRDFGNQLRSRYQTDNIAKAFGQDFDLRVQEAQLDKGISPAMMAMRQELVDRKKIKTIGSIQRYLTEAGGEERGVLRALEIYNKEMSDPVKEKYNINKKSLLNDSEIIRLAQDMGLWRQEYEDTYFNPENPRNMRVFAKEHGKEIISGIIEVLQKEEKKISGGKSLTKSSPNIVSERIAVENRDSIEKMNRLFKRMFGMEHDFTNDIEYYAKSFYRGRNEEGYDYTQMPINIDTIGGVFNLVKNNKKGSYRVKDMDLFTLDTYKMAISEGMDPNIPVEDWIKEHSEAEVLRDTQSANKLITRLQGLSTWRGDDSIKDYASLEISDWEKMLKITGLKKLEAEGYSPEIFKIVRQTFLDHLGWDLKTKEGHKAMIHHRQEMVRMPYIQDELQPDWLWDYDPRLYKRGKSPKDEPDFYTTYKHFGLDDMEKAEMAFFKGTPVDKDYQVEAIKKLKNNQFKMEFYRYNEGIDDWDTFNREINLPEEAMLPGASIHRSDFYNLRTTTGKKLQEVFMEFDLTEEEVEYYYTEFIEERKRRMEDITEEVNQMKAEYNKIQKSIEKANTSSLDFKNWNRDRFSMAALSLGIPFVGRNNKEIEQDIKDYYGSFSENIHSKRINYEALFSDETLTRQFARTLGIDARARGKNKVPISKVQENILRYTDPTTFINGYVTSSEAQYRSIQELIKAEEEKMKAQVEELKRLIKELSEKTARHHRAEILKVRLAIDRYGKEPEEFRFDEDYFKSLDLDMMNQIFAHGKVDLSNTWTNYEARKEAEQRQKEKDEVEAELLKNIQEGKRVYDSGRKYEIENVLGGDPTDWGGRHRDMFYPDDPDFSRQFDSISQEEVNGILSKFKKQGVSNIYSDKNMPPWLKEEALKYAYQEMIPDRIKKTNDMYDEAYLKNMFGDDLVFLTDAKRKEILGNLHSDKGKKKTKYGDYEYSASDYYENLVLLPNVTPEQPTTLHKSLKEKIKEPFSGISLGIKDKLNETLFRPREGRLIGSADPNKKLINSIGNLTDLAGGPLMIAIEAVTMAIQLWQQAYQNYTEDLKKASENLKEAYSNLDSANDALERTFKEGNPNATQEEIDQMMYDTYAEMGDKMAEALTMGEVDWLKKLGKDTETGPKYEYDEESSDGTMKKTEEELTTEQEYEQAIKENTGALYAAASEVSTALNNYTRKASDTWWGQDGWTGWVTDQFGGFMDKLSHSGSFGSNFMDNGNEFLLTQSQADENYAGYTEMAGLMLENFKDANGNWVTGMRTMMGENAEDLANSLGKFSTTYRYLRDMAQFSAGVGPGSLTKQQNMKIQQSMKNDPKTWKSLGKELAKRDKNQKLGKDITKNQNRIKGLTEKIRSTVGKGFRDSQIQRAAYIKQLQDMKEITDQAIVPIMQTNLGIAGQTLSATSHVGQNTGNTVNTTGSTNENAAVIAGLVAIIARQSAKAQHFDDVIAGGEDGDNDYDGTPGTEADKALYKRATQDGMTADKFYLENMKDYNSASKMYSQGFGSFGGTNKPIWERGGVFSNAENDMAGALGYTRLIEATAKMTAYDYDKISAMNTARDFANEVKGKNLADIFATVDKNYTKSEQFQQKIIDAYLLSDDEDDGTGSGGGSGGGDSGDKDKGNRKERVDLVLCNKKEIPKLNVNLFKKPPTFTVLNKNFKVRDVKINTEDTPKAIMSSIKNAFIDVQKRSDPKIIQDESAEYDPVAATDGNSLPSGTSKPNTS